MSPGSPDVVSHGCGPTRNLRVGSTSKEAWLTNNPRSSSGLPGDAGNRVACKAWANHHIVGMTSSCLLCCLLQHIIVVYCVIGVS